jgi:hypothetical protein
MQLDFIVVSKVNKETTMKKVEMIGKEFGKWTVLEEVEKRNNKRAFMCRCDCGKKYVVMGDNLRNGTSVWCMSCSSKIKGTKHNTHGMTYTRVFKIWAGMVQRCTKPYHIAYKSYGAKGVKVCPEWENSFEVFLKDMGEPPTEDHQIDRINNNGNYEPGNCRWASRKVQQNNRSNNVLITFKGETHSIAEWSKLVGIGETTLHWRMKAGWSHEKVLSTPTGVRIRKHSELCDSDNIGTI